MIENEYEGLPLILDTKVRNNEEINNFIKLLFNKSSLEKSVILKTLM